MFATAAFILAVQTAPTYRPPVDPCNHDAQLLQSTPARLPAARYKTLQGVPEALVAVTIDAQGKVIAAKIARSAGALDLDTAALDSARFSTYAPAMQNCKAAPQTFGIAIDFQPNDDDCNHDAFVVTQGAVPPMAEDILNQKPGRELTAIVRVTVAPDGSVRDATLSQSTGNSNLDAAALQAAMQSRFSPKMVNCHAVEGDYLFKTTFVRN